MSPKTSKTSFISILLCFVLVLVGLCFSQNPYSLRRPPYCSTCFTNDQNQNYYCCFYFFRCCAESRLGSDNRKLTTPSPEYPGFGTIAPIPSSTKEPDVASDGYTKCKVCPRSSEVLKSSSEEISCKCAEELLSSTARTDPDDTQPRKGPVYPISTIRPNSNTTYSQAIGGKRYEFNVPRVYPVQQYIRNTGLRNSGSLNNKPSRYNTIYGAIEGKDVPKDGTGSGAKLDDVVWGRMEPVEDIQET